MTGFKKENEVYVQFNTIINYSCYIQIKNIFHCKENQLRLHEEQHTGFFLI